MARQDNFHDSYTFAPEPVREEDRALHKWPKGYWEQCDELLAKLRAQRPAEYISVVLRQDGLFHVRFSREGRATTSKPGADRIDALKIALAGVS